MRRVLGLMLAAVVLMAHEVQAGGTVAVLERPDVVGDQVVYYYDARANFTTFITVLNTGADELTVSILFYGPTFSTPLSQAVTLAGGALTVIDVGALRGSGLPAQSGVAFATAVDLTGSPITTGALSGNFTVANLLTGSAFGAAAAARSALDDSGKRPNLGTVIDGSSDAIFPVFRQQSALLAAFYDPSTLAPVANGGNQLVFINFQDSYVPNFGAGIGSTTFNVSTTRSNGAGVSNSTFTANGVTVSDIASVAGVGVNGSSGSMFFLAQETAASLSRMIYFTESLGTFGTGYLLPPAGVQ